MKLNLTSSDPRALHRIRQLEKCIELKTLMGQRTQAELLRRKLEDFKGSLVSSEVCPSTIPGPDISAGPAVISPPVISRRPFPSPEDVAEADARDLPNLAELLKEAGF